MIGIIGIIITLFVTLILFLLSKIGNPRNIEGLIFLAQASGLSASVLISINFLLATRAKFLEKAFNGLDKVYLYHNIIGNLAFISAVLHPVFLIIASLPYNLSKLYLIPSINNIPYLLGILALYTLILLVSLTIFIDLPYKFWKKTHEFIGLVIIFGGIHSLLVSSDISYYLPLRIWMITINSIALIAYLYKRFFYYIYIPKDNYEIKNINQDGDYLLMELLKNNNSKSISFKPGQFAFFSLNNDRRNDHPFSILSEDGDTLKIGTKLVGEFTFSLLKLLPGSKINVFGPFGNFSNNLFRHNKMLWISGGIGITPFLSMANSLRGNESVTMIHSARSNEPKIFINLFLEYAKINPNFRFILHYSNIHGRLTADKIEKYLPLDNEIQVYTCGPNEMMEMVAEELPSKGIIKRKIIYEDFSLK